MTAKISVLHNRERRSFVGDIHLPEATIENARVLVALTTKMHGRKRHEFTPEMILLANEHRNMFADSINELDTAKSLLARETTLDDVLWDGSSSPKTVLSALCQLTAKDLPKKTWLNTLGNVVYLVIELLQATIDKERDYIFKDMSAKAMASTAVAHDIDGCFMSEAELSTTIVVNNWLSESMDRLNELELAALDEQLDALRRKVTLARLRLQLEEAGKS